MKIQLIHNNLDGNSSEEANLIIQLCHWQGINVECYETSIPLQLTKLTKGKKFVIVHEGDTITGFFEFVDYLRENGLTYC